ncbi:hypothetical protein GCM10022258_42330 [Aquimarina gracilis]
MEISTVMYYQLNIDYIVEKYCVNKERPRLNCNGKCYLMSQMKAKTQPGNKKSDTIIITEAFIPLFFQENNIQIKNTNPILSEQIQNWKSKRLHLKTVSKDIDHPPEDSLS